MDILRAVLGGSRALALVVALLGAAVGARAESAAATDEAFGALLAMPGAQPKEGGWIIPQEPAKDETALIARLRRLKKQGADFNAMRHRGTLLAHAIRAGDERTAVWLLRNGADPGTVLFDGREDAYALALEFGRTAVASVLVAQYGFRPKQPVASSTRAASSNPAKPDALAAPTQEQQSVALLAQWAGPQLRPSVEAQQAWRRYAATLSQDAFRSMFRDGRNLDRLVILTRHTDGGLEEALARLPVELVRQQAPLIAGLLADSSFASDGVHPEIVYTGASRSWPALWRRLDQPLSYERWPGLAGRIPPDLWPGLFASGYADHEAEATGCLLAAVDLPGLKALWPDFQRYFVDARDEAAGLVLVADRIAQERSPCTSGSSPAEAAAKLVFLRANGVTGPVHGLRRARPSDPPALALEAMIDAFSPKEKASPRLVRAVPGCVSALDGRWWTALAKVRQVGWGIPPTRVQVVEVPGVAACGLLVSGTGYPDSPRFSDDFRSGPDMDPPTPRFADAPDDGEIWVMGPAGTRRVDVGFETRGMLSGLRQVRDRETGKHYLLNSGRRASLGSSYQLPDAFEWQIDDKGPRLVPSRDQRLVVRLLRQQCQESEEDDEVTCPSLNRSDLPLAEGASPLDPLRTGDAVLLRDLLDAAGADRRAAYRAVLAEGDHGQLRRLLASGVPAWWTAAEIKDLGKADLSLEVKRRRIALLFADSDQLSHALEDDKYDVMLSLSSWLPREDWKPVLRIVARQPTRGSRWRHPCAHRWGVAWGANSIARRAFFARVASSWIDGLQALPPASLMHS